MSCQSKINMLLKKMFKFSKSWDKYPSSLTLFFPGMYIEQSVGRDCHSSFCTIISYSESKLNIISMHVQSVPSLQIIWIVMSNFILLFTHKWYLYYNNYVNK